MKLETLFTLAALGAAAVFVVVPRRAAATTVAPSAGVRLALPGGAGSQWTDAASAAYRDQLAAELAAQPEFWI